MHKFKRSISEPRPAHLLYMSDRPVHSWELPGSKRPRWDQAPDELRDEGGFWGELSDSDSEPEITPGQELVDKLLSLHLCNRISASDCCTSMWWGRRPVCKKHCRTLCLRHRQVAIAAESFAMQWVTTILNPSINSTSPGTPNTTCPEACTNSPVCLFMSKSLWMWQEMLGAERS